MCYESLIDGDGTDTPIGTLLRDEFSAAVRNGAMAGALAIAVLAVQGYSPVLIAGLAGVAVLLGTVLHQLVLLAGTGLVRANARVRTARDETSRDDAEVRPDIDEPV